MIYGTKLKEVGNELITDKCRNCGSQNCINIHIYQKYAHVLHIPAFPLRKTAVSQCDQCKQILKLSAMSSNLTSAYENCIQKLKTPVWMFSGLIIFVSLLVYALISDKIKNDRNANWVNSPAVGDVYDVRLKNAKFSLFKVTDITEDSIYLKVHLFETTKFAGLKDLRKKGAEAYSENKYGYSFFAIQEMFKNGEILNVER